MPKNCFVIPLVLLAFLISNSVQAHTAEAAPAEAKPGKIGVYRIARALHGQYKGRLVLDLGFGQYLRFGELNNFAPGDLIYAEPVRDPKKGFASQFHFQRVWPIDSKYKIQVNPPKNPMYGDVSMLHTYNANVIEVLDGGTFVALVDLGFGMTARQTLRIRSSAPADLTTPEGARAKAEFEKWLWSKDGALLIKAGEKAGRDSVYSAEVWLGNA